MPAAHFSNSERQQKVSHNTISSLNLANPPCVRTKLRKYHRWSPYCNSTTHRKCPFFLLVPKTPCTKGPHSTYRLIWESLSSRTIFSFKPRSSDSSPSIVPAQATTPSFSLLYTRSCLSPMALLVSDISSGSSRATSRNRVSRITITKYTERKK